MKRVLLVGVCLVALGHRAQAQWTVISPTADAISLSQLGKEALSEAHQAQEVINTAQTVLQVTAVLNGVAHGNLAGLAQLGPLLDRLDISNPLGGGFLGGIVSDTIGQQNAADLSLLFQVGSTYGSLAASTLSLVQQAKLQTMLYQSPANDFSALQMARQAAALAGQMGTSQSSVGSSSQRLASMPAILHNAENADDVKTSVDAGNTLIGQQVSQTAHTNQLLALMLTQAAAMANERNLDAQNWRLHTDQLAATAAQAAAAARGGQVQFITVGTSLPAAAPSALGTLAPAGGLPVPPVPPLSGDPAALPVPPVPPGG